MQMAEEPVLASSGSPTEEEPFPLPFLCLLGPAVGVSTAGLAAFEDPVGGDVGASPWSCTTKASSGEGGDSGATPAVHEYRSRAVLVWASTADDGNDENSIGVHGSRAVKPPKVPREVRTPIPWRNSSTRSEVGREVARAAGRLHVSSPLFSSIPQLCQSTRGAPVPVPRAGGRRIRIAA